MYTPVGNIRRDPAFVPPPPWHYILMMGQRSYLPVPPPPPPPSQTPPPREEVLARVERPPAPPAIPRKRTKGDAEGTKSKAASKAHPRSQANGTGVDRDLPPAQENTPLRLPDKKKPKGVGTNEQLTKRPVVPKAKPSRGAATIRVKEEAAMRAEVEHNGGSATQHQKVAMSGSCPSNSLMAGTAQKQVHESTVPARKAARSAGTDQKGGPAYTKQLGPHSTRGGDHNAKTNQIRKQPNATEETGATRSNAEDKKHVKNDKKKDKHEKSEMAPDHRKGNTCSPEDGADRKVAKKREGSNIDGEASRHQKRQRTSMSKTNGKSQMTHGDKRGHRDPTPPLAHRRQTLRAPMCRSRQLLPRPNLEILHPMRTLNRGNQMGPLR